MSVLKPGLSIFLDKASDYTSQIWLSLGTELASKRPITTNQYCSLAYIPVEPWRLPTMAESELLGMKKTKITWETGSCLAVTHINNKIMTLFEQLGVNNIKSYVEYKKIVTSPQYEDVLKNVVELVTPLLVYPDGLQVLGLSYREAGLETTTFDKNRGCFIGLHLDSWDRLPLAKRVLARNRLCVNLGSEDRFLIFINLTLLQMIEQLNISSPEEFSNMYRSSNPGPVFTENFPLYPVVKLKISPGEAYIAPTENMIHDGSTKEKRHPDICLTLLGYFGVSQ